MVIEAKTKDMIFFLEKFLLALEKDAKASRRPCLTCGEVPDMEKKLESDGYVEYRLHCCNHDTGWRGLFREVDFIWNDLKEDE